MHRWQCPLDQEDLKNAIARRLQDASMMKIRFLAERAHRLAQHNARVHLVSYLEGNHKTISLKTWVNFSKL